jgi:cobaltochelatase CobT
MAEENPLENLRLALEAGLRALGRRAEFQLAYTADKPACNGDSARVPQPPRTLAADQVAEARGWADSFALKRRLHDARSHASVAVPPGLAREMFNAAEQARIEAVGGRDMAGVAANLRRMTETRFRTDPLARARTPDEVPLAAAIQLLVRERLTGEVPPANVRPALDLVRGQVEEAAGVHLNALAALQDDQLAFAQAFVRVLQDLGLAEDSAPEADEQEQDAAEADSGDEEQQDSPQQQDADASDSSVDSRAEASEDGEETESRDIDINMDDLADAEMGDEGEEGMMPWRPNLPESALTPDFDYRVFSTRHDEVVAAEELCDAEELTRLRGYLDQQLVSLQGAVTKLANRLQRRLLAQQNRSWDFDQEEGLLDTARWFRSLSTIPGPCVGARSRLRRFPRTFLRARWNVAR